MRASAEGFPTTAIGLIASVYSVGFIVGCLIVPLIIRRVGHIRTYAVVAAVLAMSLMFYVLMPHPIVWMVLRCLSGVAVAGLLMVIESWLNERAENRSRARIFGIYLMINYASNFAGQIFVATGDPRGFGLFAACAAVICAALIPVSLTRAVSPAPPVRITVRLGRLYRLSPVGITGALAAGMANGAFFSMGPIFAQGTGLALFQITLFTGIALLGGAVTQWPLGMIADRIDRRRVIAGSVLVAAIVGLILSVLAGHLEFGGTAVTTTPLLTGGALIVVVTLYGMAAHPLYGLSVAHTNDYVESEGFVEASSGLLMAWAIGASIGPIAAAMAMQAFGSGALFLVTASVHMAIFVFALYRIRRRATRTEDRKSEFVPVGIAKPTPVVGRFDPRAADDT